MDELARRRPALLATDVGPVIDAEAQGAARRRTSRACARAGRRVHQLRLPRDGARHLRRADHGRDRGISAEPRARGVRPGAARPALPARRAAAGGRGHQRHRLRPDARHAHAASTRRWRRSSTASAPATSTSTATWSAPWSACSPSAGTGCRARDRRPAARSTCTASVRGTRSRRYRARRSRCPARPASRNALEFHPRGVILCMARDERTLVAQAKAALALGNKVRCFREPSALAARDQLEPAGRADRQARSRRGRCRAARCQRGSRARMRAEFAAARGPIVPIVECGRDGECELDAPRRRAHGDRQHGGGRRQRRRCCRSPRTPPDGPRVGRPGRFRNAYFDAAAIRERLSWPRMLAALDAMSRTTSRRRCGRIIRSTSPASRRRRCC